ncbi:fimbrial protein [Escherichia sp. E2562]|uniref:fimbrial protein n=1 Tax=unclassified Escherichia TaxID=2608889 RepID=UPI00107EF6AF|nr:MULTISPECIES: fimbrial protein [unclassified Escherichia]TGC20551.1 fimbrial protein [Escherichia sp. E2562]TLI74662.1 fimbrial protein [Escherichia sp. E1130]TLI84664.1 fimbrial protein [Escherichia sp. E2562]
MQRNNNNPLLQLCHAILLFLIFSGYVFADTGAECYIENGSNGDYTMDISPSIYHVVTKQVTSVSEMADGVWDVPIVLRGGGIGCKAVSAGDESVHFIDVADATLQTGYVNEVGAALLKTTVQGIAYSVELLCTNCGQREKPNINLDLRLLPSGEDNFTPNPDVWWVWADTDYNWSLRFRLYYTPEFKPQEGVSSGKIMPGPIALWRIGPSFQPTIRFLMQSDSLNFTVEEPTCTTIALDPTKGNIKGNEVSLGDSYISEINEGITREVPFSIRGDFCYANKITVKLNAKNAAPDKKLIGKSSGSATGVGVKIYSTANDNKLQLNADGSNAVVLNYTNWSNNLLYFPFTAQLVKDGGSGVVDVGDFTGKATFSFSYE